MKTIFALPLLAFGLAACQTYPNDPYGQGQGPYGYPEPAPYPQPYPQPYPEPYPQPYPSYPPQPYPQPGYPDTPQGIFNLSNTNWRVVSINGQQVPMSGYYFNFMPDRLSGKLGCNTIGAGYSVNGNTLNAAALMMTRMACPNGSFETQGTAIMARPMAISESGDTLTLSNHVGAIVLVRAR